MGRGSPADGVTVSPSHAGLVLPCLPCCVAGWRGERCRRGTVCFAPGCPAPCRVKRASGVACAPAWLGVQAWLRVQGAKCEAGAGNRRSFSPEWDSYPQAETGGERGGAPFLPSAGSGVRRRLPLLPPSPKPLSAYLEEYQAWNRISLSTFQQLVATEGLTFSEVSMSAGSTNRQSGGSSGSCGREVLLLPAEEVVSGGLGWSVGRRGSEVLVLGGCGVSARCPALGGFAVLLVLAGGRAALCRGC